MKFLDISTRKFPHTFAKVDDDVYDFLMTLKSTRGGSHMHKPKKWRLHTAGDRKDGTFVVSTDNINHSTILLSWLVHNFKNGRYIDLSNLDEMCRPPTDSDLIQIHKDGDSLNNQYLNLLHVNRHVSPHQKHKGTRYCGVESRILKSGEIRWHARIKSNKYTNNGEGEYIYLGTFDTDVEAARAYDKKLKEFGLPTINNV